MSDEVLEKTLIANLARINEWLRFAETKNAALLTFSSAWLVAVCSLWSNDKTPPPIRTALLFAFPFIAAGAIIAVCSLLPKNQNKNAGDTAQQLTTKNLLFHGNVGRLDIATAPTAFRVRYGSSANGGVSVDHVYDLSTQLVETSRIAHSKFRLFAAGAKAILLGFVVGFITFVVSAIYSLL